MYNVICDTSPIQYLHQLDLLYILPALTESVCVPPAVVHEVSVGLTLGVTLPDPAQLDWLTVRSPVSRTALPLINDLGPGETEALMLALESRESVVVLDDNLARNVADTLDLLYTGTLGLLLDAKHAELIPAVHPLLERLQALRFYLAAQTRVAVLKLAGELEDRDA